MDDLPTPLSRIELYLAKACGMDVTVPEQPESRLEDFLAVIAGDTSIVLPTPMSLTELWLNHVAGGALTDEMKLEGAYWIGPQKVDVRFFAVAGGMDGVVAPQPQNRTEQYWARIAEIRPIHGVLKYATGASITLTDVVRGITSLENVYGDTVQQTYTGKNLLNPFTFVKGRTDNGVIGYASGTTSITSTASSITFVTNQSYRGIVSDAIEVTGSTDYVVQWTLDTQGVTVGRFVDGYDENSDWISRISAPSSTGLFTTPANCKYVRISFIMNEASTATVSSLQVEKSATATAFEPYVGGIPSPNPDYPQDMQVVTGEQTVNIHGKNIFNGGTWRQIRTDGGIPASVAGESIIVDSGTNFVEFSVPTTYRGAESDYIPVTAGQTITLSFNAVKICNRMWISQYDTSKNRLSTLNPDSKIVATTTFTTTNDGYIRVAFGNTAGGENFEFDNIQLELGSTATAYEPYQSQSYEVNLGKNLFDISKVLTYGTSLVNNGDGTLTITTSPSDSAVTATAPNKLSDYCPNLKVGDTVTLSADTTGTQKRIYLSTAAQTWNFGASKTITQEMLNSTISWYASGVPSTATISNIQVELGTATSYAPYFTPIELCKIGTYQDYIYKSGSDWYVHKAINKRILNGTEYWETGGNGASFTTSVTDYATSNNTPYSNYFTGINNVAGITSVPDNSVCFINQSGQTTPRFYVRYTNIFANATALKTWLSTNTPSIYYALATATDTKITDSTLTSQLNAVNSATLPKPVAYLTVGSTSPNLPASIKISYYGEEE